MNLIGWTWRSISFLRKHKRQLELSLTTDVDKFRPLLSAFTKPYIRNEKKFLLWEIILLSFNNFTGSSWSRNDWSSLCLNYGFFFLSFTAGRSSFCHSRRVGVEFNFNTIVVPSYIFYELCTFNECIYCSCTNIANVVQRRERTTYSFNVKFWLRICYEELNKCLLLSGWGPVHYLSRHLFRLGKLKRAFKGSPYLHILFSHQVIKATEAIFSL